MASKAKRSKTRNPYISKEKTAKNMQSEDSETAENLKLLDEIASFEPGKNAQIAARKISQKYKKLREAK